MAENGTEWCRMVQDSADCCIQDEVGYSRLDQNSSEWCKLVKVDAGW